MHDFMLLVVGVVAGMILMFMSLLFVTVRRGKMSCNDPVETLMRDITEGGPKSPPPKPRK